MRLRVHSEVHAFCTWITHETKLLNPFFITILIFMSRDIWPFFMPWFMKLNGIQFWFMLVVPFLVNYYLQDTCRGQDLMEVLCKHLNLLETAYFGLRFVDKENQTVRDFASLFSSDSPLVNSFIFLSWWPTLFLFRMVVCLFMCRTLSSFYW